MTAILEFVDNTSLVAYFPEECGWDSMPPRDSLPDQGLVHWSIYSTGLCWVLGVPNNYYLSQEKYFLECRHRYEHGEKLYAMFFEQ